MNCQGVTSKGTPCKRKVSAHSRYCKLHAPKIFTKVDIGELRNFLCRQPQITAIYKIGNPLASQTGTYGQLFHVTHKVTRKPAIIKAQIQTGIENRNKSLHLQREYQIIHDNYVPDQFHIIQVIDIFENIEYTPGSQGEVRYLAAFTMEPMACNLTEYIQTYSIQKDHMITELIETMAQFHISGYLHCDIKPGNFCIRDIDQNKPELVLIDFGTCVRDSETMVGGTQRYQSLNSHLHPDAVSFGDDMESLGYLIWELLYGRDVLNKKPLIRTKQTLSNVPPFIADYIKACRAIPRHSTPDYEMLLSILVPSHNDPICINLLHCKRSGIKDDFSSLNCGGKRPQPRYIEPSTKRFTLYDTNDIAQCPGMTNQTALAKAGITSVNKLIGKYYALGQHKNEFIAYMKHLGIPQNEAATCFDYIQVRVVGIAPPDKQKETGDDNGIDSVGKLLGKYFTLEKNPYRFASYLIELGFPHNNATMTTNFIHQIFVP
jgi:serine/threonine protein kinase